MFLAFCLVYPRGKPGSNKCLLAGGGYWGEGRGGNYKKFRFKNQGEDSGEDRVQERDS